MLLLLTRKVAFLFTLDQKKKKKKKKNRRALLIANC